MGIMKDSEITKKTINRVLANIAHLADSASKSSRGHVPSKELMLLVMELDRLSATLEIQKKHEMELEAREGVEGKYVHGKCIKFFWRNGDHTRSVEVYPNAHNNGQTFGVRTWERVGYADSKESWYGFNWDWDDARLAAKEWANEGRIPVHPMDVIKEVMER